MWLNYELGFSNTFLRATNDKLFLLHGVSDREMTDKVKERYLSLAEDASWTTRAERCISSLFLSVIRLNS